MMPKIIIRLENLSILLIACGLYISLNGENIYLSFERWYLIILVWISFDLSMFGYLINKKIGSVIYNLVHNYVLAVVIIGIGINIMNLNMVSVGTILLIHISLDRLLGFGLKYPSDFKHTHIQKL